MQDIDINLDWIQDLIDLGFWFVGWFFGLLPFTNSGHELSLLVWFILASLGGAVIFIKYYGDGIIMDTIEYSFNEGMAQSKTFARELRRATGVTTRRVAKGKVKVRRKKRRKK